MQKTYTLKAGTDYEPKLYIYKNDMWNECADSNPNNISEEGKYLYTVRGKGNFCGTAFGQTYTQVFNDGSDGTPNPAVCSYVGTDIRACQFIVIGDASQDLANASITVKKTQLNYKYGKFYTADDFGIKVTVGSGSDKRVLTEGVDYYVTFDGADFRYISGKNKSTGMYYSSTAYEVYSGSAGNNAKINLANKYDVTITAINGNSNGIFGSKKAKSVRIKGVTISSGWFKFKTSSLKYTGDNSSSYKYTLSRSAKVSVKSPDSVLSFKSESGTYYSSNYTDIKESMLPADTVFVMRDGENKNPGTYEMEVLPIGPGVDHDYVAKVNFKRTGITTKEAMKAGILSVTCDAADYNAGGALPKNIKVTLNGVTNNLGDLEYNGQSFYIDDYYYGMTADPTYVKITITVSNNTKTGNSAGLYITGDGKVFTGKSDKITYAVEGIDVKDITIPVLSKDSYSYEYGKLTPYIKQSDTNSFFATYEPVSKPAKGSVSPKIELYQVYCDKNGNKALAKINKSQYKLTLTENGSNRYSVVVSNTKPKMITGYDFSNVKIAEDYTVYDSTASIVGARVKVNGQEYSFPMDNSTSFTFTGSQIRFDKKAGDGVVSVTLKDGTELTPDDFTVEYGDNTAIGTGKKGGSFTITLKRNDKTATYKYGGKATFYFSISKSGTIVM